MAIAKGKTAKAAQHLGKKNKFEIETRLGIVNLKEIKFKTNSKGTKYIGVGGFDKPVTVYANINDVKPGLNMLVQFKKTGDNKEGMYALNTPTDAELLSYWSGMLSDYPGMDIASIKAVLGL